MNPNAKKVLLLALPLLGLALLLPSNMGNNFANKSLTRGLRNNNPGCLRISKEKWLGKVKNPLDTEFESFDTMDNGVRAAVRNAYAQWNKGKDSIQSFISVWAPRSENDTKAYVAKVAKAAGISPTAEFKFGNNETTAKIIYAVFAHECGPRISEFVSTSDIRKHLASMWP